MGKNFPAKSRFAVFIVVSLILIAVVIFAKFSNVVGQGSIADVSFSPEDCYIPTGKPAPGDWRYHSIPNPSIEWHELYLYQDGKFLVDYPGIGLNENPVTSAQYALALYNEFLLGDNRKLTEFIQLTGHLATAGVGSDGAIYPLAFDYEPYGLKAGWTSGIVQGQIASVLARRYLHTGEEGLVSLMRAVIRQMLIPVEKGGLSRAAPSGHLWIEEYPSAKPSYVLNGFMFSIIGVADYLRVRPEDHEIREVFNELIASLKANVHLFDLGSWHLYDLLKSQRVSDLYMRFHVLEIDHLARLTHDQDFRTLCLKWADYD